MPPTKPVKEQSYIPKAKSALAILRELAKAKNQTVSAYDNSDWSTSGGGTRPTILRLLASEGAIETKTQRGRSGGTCHTLTETGAWLFQALSNKTLTKPENWRRDVNYVKWSLLLPNDEHKRNGKQAQLLQDCERVALSEAWRGSLEHHTVIVSYGTVEANALLELSQYIPGTADISFEGLTLDKAQVALREKMVTQTGLSVAGLQRIAEILLFKLLSDESVAEHRHETQKV